MPNLNLLIGINILLVLSSNPNFNLPKASFPSPNSTYKDCTSTFFPSFIHNTRFYIYQRSKSAFSVVTACFVGAKVERESIWIRSSKMESFFINQQTNHGIIDLDSVSSSSDVSSVASLESDCMEEEVTSSTSSSPPISSTSSKDRLATGPLNDMSSLLQQLPFKRGLSKHYNGKSQSFGSLSSVRSLEDLAKPENPYNKRLKSSKSYGGLSEKSSPPKTFSRLIKKASKGSCSSLSAKRSGSFLGSRPPIPPHRSTSTLTMSNHTALFA